ncbi:hypothetical protein [Gorillibacterium sp. CAU 1737]|uniref:hypothetical protein n=1 Tax=Gorillibacterium sp. CAU 1737 TaxID=3140362 RepID=UPI0032611208
MNKDQFKRAIDQVEPPVEMKERVKRYVENAAKNQQRAGESMRITKMLPKRFGAVAAGFLILALAGGIYYGWEQRNATPHAIGPEPTTTTGQLAPSGTSTPGSVHLPKLELPKETGPLMDMIGLFVYKGRIYTQTASSLAPERAKDLLGEKVGRTTGGIDEWSKQSDYATELASTIGQSDIYSVQGYDESFRLMTYDLVDGQVYAQLYENLNDRSLVKGEDLFGLLGLKNEVTSAEYVTFSNWNQGENHRTTVANRSAVDEFVDALYEAKPLDRKAYLDTDLYSEENGQAFLHLVLKDGTDVELRLFQQGYVSYGFADVLFKVDGSAFENLWKELMQL